MLRPTAARFVYGVLFSVSQASHTDPTCAGKIASRSCFSAPLMEKETARVRRVRLAFTTCCAALRIVTISVGPAPTVQAWQSSSNACKPSNTFSMPGLRLRPLALASTAFRSWSPPSPPCRPPSSPLPSLLSQPLPLPPHSRARDCYEAMPFLAVTPSTGLQLDLSASAPSCTSSLPRLPVTYSVL